MKILLILMIAICSVIAKPNFNEIMKLPVEEQMNIFNELKVPYKYENGKIDAFIGSEYLGMTYEEALKKQQELGGDNGNKINNDNNINTDNSNTNSVNNNTSSNGFDGDLNSDINKNYSGGIGGISSQNNSSGNLGTSSGTQTIMTAFTFGSAGIAFSIFPFLFVIIRGILKANTGHNQHSSSVLSVFLMGFFVHFVSCIGFMTLVKLMDTLKTIYESNYLQNKIFSIFWARGESTVFNLANASGSIEDKGAYLQLLIIQTAFDWFILAIYPFIFVCATAYGTLQAKKDNYQGDWLQVLIWVAVANIVAFFAFVLWAKIAQISLFIPNGEDILSMINNAYKDILENSLH